MKSRIAVWAGAGALVVVFWTLYIPAVSPPNASGVAWALEYLTCPIALARHYTLSFYTVLLVNAATYSLVGMVVETIRRNSQGRLISN
jgi:hypothetical protein